MSITLIGAAYLLGLAGSAHCAGMCGPMVGLLEAGIAGGARPRLTRRIAYHAGRLSVYLFAGLAVAGLTGTLARLPWLGFLGQTLRWVGVALVALIGVQLLLRSPAGNPLDAVGRKLWKRIAPAARHLLPMNTITRAYLGGLLWGSIPCGMLYSVVAIAATAASATEAALVMLAFWSATLPVLLMIGFGGASMNKTSLRPLAGALMVLLAMFSAYTLLPDPAMPMAMHQH